MSVRTTLAALLAMVAAVSVPAIAQAQASKPLALQIGVGTALSSNTSDKVSGTSFHAGAALAFTDTTTLFALPGSEGIDVDYNQSSGHGGEIEAYGATYTNRISLLPKIVQPLTAKVVPYVGFGIGVFDNQVRKQITTTTAVPTLHARADASEDPETTTTTSTKSSTTTSLGGKLIAGVNFPGDVFLEASYIISGTSEGIRTDSLNLAVGAHF